MRVVNGARFDAASTFGGRLELHGGTVVAEGKDARLLVKYHNIYDGGVEVITNQALLVSLNGGATSIHSGGRLTLADQARYCKDEDGTGNGSLSEAMNGTLEILSGSMADFGPRVQVGTVLSASGNLLIDGPGSSLKVNSEKTQDFHGMFIGGPKSGPMGTGTVTVANGGLINGQVQIFPNGTLQGNGRISPRVGGVSNGGTVKPGWPVTGTLTIENGDFTMVYSNRINHVIYPGAIEFQLGDTDAGDFDQLVVGGTLTLGGTCTLGLVEGYSPEVNTTWQILDWTTLVGEFDTINLLDGDWDTSNLYVTGEVTFIPPPIATIIVVR